MACSLLWSIQVLASESQKIIRYENQRDEIFDLENFLKETRYKTETVDSTCYRQEPYTEYVCRDVTRYREECSTIPAHNECRTEYESVCHTENRYENECNWERGEPSCRVVVNYRRECSHEGGGRQCRTIPGDVECHRLPNGENRCVKIPPREECSDSPGREVCRQVPYEERECTEGPSRQVCRQVSRPEQVCQNVPRQRCETVPAQRVCQQVPYSETVCGNETLYRQIPYACKEQVQVPYEVTLKTHQANVKMVFDQKAAQTPAEFRVSLNTKGALDLKAKALAKDLVGFMKKQIKNTESADINLIDALFNISLFDKKDLFNVTTISDVVLRKNSLEFVVDGKFDIKRSSLATKIVKKDETKFEKTLRGIDLKTEFDGTHTRVFVDLEKFGAPDLGGIFNKKHTVSLVLKVDYSEFGELLFPSEELKVSNSVEVKVTK